MGSVCRISNVLYVSSFAQWNADPYRHQQVAVDSLSTGKLTEVCQRAKLGEKS